MRRFGAGAIIVLFLLTMLYVTGLTWVSEHDSCLRQEGVRQSNRIVASTAQQARQADADNARKHGNLKLARQYDQIAARYAVAVSKAHPLVCGKVFPDTQ